MERSIDVATVGFDVYSQTRELDVWVQGRDVYVSAFYILAPISDSSSRFYVLSLGSLRSLSVEFISDIINHSGRFLRNG